MKESVHADRFVTRFDEINRSNNFSVSARYALFEYFEQIEEDMGEEMEFDPIAICCEFAEYESVLSFADEYFEDIQQAASELGLEIAMSGDEFEDEDDEIEEAIREYIRNRGQLIEFEGGIIVSNF